MQITWAPLLGALREITNPERCYHANWKKGSKDSEAWHCWALQLRAELKHLQGKRCQSLQVRNCCVSTHEVFAQPRVACAGSDPFYPAPLTLPNAPDFPAWPPPSVPQGRSLCWCSPCPTVPSLPSHDKSSSAGAPQSCRSAPAASPARAQGAVRALWHNHPAQSFFPFHLHHPCS